MPSSSSQPLERGLDAMLIVYALLEGHPASAACEEFIRNRLGWFTTALTLLEVKAVLSKVYGVEAKLVSDKLAQLAAGPVVILAVETPVTLAAMKLSDALGIDLTDAVLLQTAQDRQIPHLATDDGRLAQVCSQVGIIAENPLDAALRKRVAEWEAAHLPAKGLPRVLARIHQWLRQTDAAVAETFHARTGGGSHLP